MSKSWPFALPVTQRTTALESEQPVPAPSRKAGSTALTFWVGLILFLGLIVLILAVTLIVLFFQRSPEPQHQARVEWTRQPFIFS
uniref:Uncharacterized protein n=1 Tax=viral metagenome TaxID=1070528 RepID=A0A6C0IYU4_9ZZZZ